MGMDRVRRTCWERHQLIEFLCQISLHSIRCFGFVDASLGVVSSSEIIQFCDFLDHGGDGDDGKMFGGEQATRFATVNEIFGGFSIGVECLGIFEMGRILLRFILCWVSGNRKVSTKEEK